MIIAVSQFQAVSDRDEPDWCLSQKLLVLSSVHVGCRSKSSSPGCWLFGLPQETVRSARNARGNKRHLCFMRLKW